jgi:hypothetical protein
LATYPLPRSAPQAPRVESLGALIASLSTIWRVGEAWQIPVPFVSGPPSFIKGAILRSFAKINLCSPPFFNVNRPQPPPPTTTSTTSISQFHPQDTNPICVSDSTSMKKTSPNSESIADRIRSWARTKAHGPSPLSKDTSRTPTLPLSNQDIPQNAIPPLRNDSTNIPPFPSTDLNGLAREPSKPTANNVADNTSTDIPPPAPPPQVDGEGDVVIDEQTKPKNVALRFWLTAKSIILSSIINVLLVFVPIGIAAKAANLSPGIVFGMNAIAIIPLAGLLSHATESVAKRMGDTIGALMNVTFGNAVELIILYVSHQFPSRTMLTLPSMYVYLTRDQDKKEREALLKALSYQSSPISFTSPFPPPYASSP